MTELQLTDFIDALMKRGDPAYTTRYGALQELLGKLAAQQDLIAFAEACAIYTKDDYLAAAATAKQEVAAGKRVWWAADALGARYYGLPGDFDYMGELTGQHKPHVCRDQPGVQAIAAAPAGCLEKLLAPDVVILSKPETFDAKGVIAAYLKAGRFAKTQELPAFTIWRPAPATGAATSAPRAIDARQ